VTTEPAPAQTKPAGRGALVAGVVVLLAVAGIVGLIVWAVVTSDRAAPVSHPEPSFESYEPGWTSAMAKAGVEATFPGGPVELTEVRPTGRRPFEATFTAEEITALLNVYRFEADLGGQSVSISDATAEFPAPGVGALSGTLSAGGSTYSAAIEGPLVHTAKGIDSPGATSLTVEGFGVGGERRRQATEAMVAYLNRYLMAAPGLTVQSARILEGGLQVSGTAPASLEHPAPTP